MIMNNLNIGFIGFGLIGGSIARSLKQANPNHHIIVTSRSLAPLKQAKEDGIVDQICEDTDQTFSQCDFIFLCTPVVTITKYLRQLKNIVKDGCIITDVGSVKGTIHEAVHSLNMEDCFIGGHPMTGSELSGYANSSSEIMVGAKYVITPTCKTTREQLDAYMQLIRIMKSEPVIMDYRQHDYTVAGISHIPHITSACLAKLVEESDDDAHDMHLLAAGGFKDTTRIASSSPEMWEQICQTNSDAITDILSRYITLLTDIRDNISNQTENYVYNLFKESGKYRNTFTDQ